MLAQPRVEVLQHFNAGHVPLLAQPVADGDDLPEELAMLGVTGAGDIGVSRGVAVRILDVTLHNPVDFGLRH